MSVISQILNLVLVFTLLSTTLITTDLFAGATPRIPITQNKFSDELFPPTFVLCLKGTILPPDVIL